MFQLRLIRISLILTALVINPTHAQITWKNVTSNPLPDPSRQMEAARGSMNGGFDQLRNMVNDQENIDRDNWNIRKNNNTQDYLDALYRYTGLAKIGKQRHLKVPSTRGKPYFLIHFTRCWRSTRACD